MNLIADSKLIKIPVKDNGEQLVDLRTVCRDIKFDICEPYIDDRFFLSRKTAAEKIAQAQSSLISGFKLVIFSAYRPMDIQKKHYEDMLEKLRNENPEWTDQKIKLETNKRIAPPDIIPPHTTGGAIDLSIVDKNDEYLDMGTIYKEFSSKTQTDSDQITNREKQNREMLSNIMKTTGFVNYPTEWWHWSYGDRYWAASLKKRLSIYNSVDLPKK